MSYKAKFDGWEKLELADLLVAYRKAKADCFFENAFPTAINFAEYEQHLLLKLNILLESLKAGKGFISKPHFLGTCRLVPKKLNIEPRNKTPKGHIHFSNPKKSFDQIKDNNTAQSAN